MVQLLEVIAKDFAVHNMKFNLVHTDNGTEFTSNAVAEIVAKYGGKVIYGAPYHPQSQGCVERFNHTVKVSIDKAMSKL